LSSADVIVDEDRPKDDDDDGDEEGGLRSDAPCDGDCVAGLAGERTSVPAVTSCKTKPLTPASLARTMQSREEVDVVVVVGLLVYPTRAPNDAAVRSASTRPVVGAIVINVVNPSTARQAAYSRARSAYWPGCSACCWPTDEGHKRALRVEAVEPQLFLGLSGAGQARRRTSTKHVVRSEDPGAMANVYLDERSECSHA
jgi:hypothetical protein